MSDHLDRASEMLAAQREMQQAAERQAAAERAAAVAARQEDASQADERARQARERQRSIHEPATTEQLIKVADFLLEKEVPTQQCRRWSRVINVSEPRRESLRWRDRFGSGVQARREQLELENMQTWVQWFEGTFPVGEYWPLGRFVVGHTGGGSTDYNDSSLHEPLTPVYKDQFLGTDGFLLEPGPLAWLRGKRYYDLYQATATPALPYLRELPSTAFLAAVSSPQALQIMENPAILLTPNL